MSVIIHATFVFLCATSVVQIHFINTDFIWSVTSYSIFLIIHFEKKKTFEFDIKGDIHSIKLE